MEAESYGSNSRTRWLLLATAYFFSLCPALAIVLLSVAIMRFLRGEVGSMTRAGGFGQAPEIALLIALGVLVTLATFRIRRALEGMRNANRRYQLALESAPDGIIIADASGSYLEANSAAARMLGYSHAQLLELSHDDLRQPEAAHACELFAGSKTLCECGLRQQGGGILPVELTASRLDQERVMIIVRDITARKKAEELLRTSEDKYRRLFQANLTSELRYRLLFQENLAGVYRATVRGRFLECNQSFADMLGCRSRGEVVAHSPERFFHAPDGFRSFTELLEKQRRVTGYELCRRKKDGSPLWVLESAYLMTDERLSEEVLQGTVIDISERRQADEAVRKSLSEKEVLLKEIHHRVKNNLQVISSLLSLQADRVRDPVLLASFRESQNRVRSIALLHEGLYQSRDLARIDFGAYLRRLTEQLSSTFGASSSAIRLRVTVEPVTLGLDYAVPCALAVNELVSNAFKHAFPDGTGGEIHVSLRAEDQGKVAVTVKDTGIGLPEGVEMGKADSLGLRLLDTLVRQLKGSLQHSTGNQGTEFRILFSGAES